MEHDLSDKNKLKVKEKKLKLQNEREIEDVKHLLSSVQGRRFFWRYFAFCRVLEQCAENSGSWTYFNEGRRVVGLQMFADMSTADPDAYLKMINEAKES